MKRLINILTGLSPAKISLLITFIMAVLYIINIGNSTSYFNLMDKKWVDLIQKTRGVIEHSDQVVIAAVDSKSIDKYGRWPWSRKYIAQLIESLNNYYKVSTVGFDIVFSEADNENLKLAQKYRKDFEQSGLEKTSEGQILLKQMTQTELEIDGDQQLREQIVKFSNIVMGYVFLSYQQEVGHLSEKEVQEAQSRLQPHAISIVQGYDELNESSAIPEELYPELSTDKIASSAKTMFGFFNVNIDPEDGVVRRIHLIRKSQGKYYPALSLRMLAHYLGENIQIIGDDLGIVGIQVGSNEITPNPDGSVLLNYKGPGSTFTHHSVADIIEHKIPTEALRGKIVLVGVSEVGILDLRVTPVSEAYAGVEVHANAIDNFLTGSYFQLGVMNHVYTLLFLLLIGIAGGFILPRIKLVVALLLFSSLLGGYTFFHQFCVNVLLNWPSYVYVATTMILVFAGVSQYMFFVSDKDKRFIKDAFQQYLSPAVIKDLLDNPGMLALGGEEKVLTALFSDVAGFSTISEKLTPPELVSLLNDYLTEMTDIIMKYDGTVDKFEGDAIIAFFGAPVSFDDHANRAALVCLDMENRVAELRPKWKEDWGVEIFHRVGINTGPMVVGNMGSRNRFDYTMMGNSVNLAARLEGVNKMYGTRAMMSEMTYAECENEVEGRELDMIRVIGINKPVRIYEIVCRKGNLDAQKKEAFYAYSKGLELYRSQQWGEALSLFEKTLEIIPGDGPATTFIKRVKQYMETPPPIDWDGVYTATSK
ncbi:adenylate/guanylate cyclase domain-containing protein [Deltaproteobacteria bacterium TL4]